MMGHPAGALLLAALAALLAASPAATATGPTVGYALTGTGYSVAVDGTTWFEAPSTTTICVAGTAVTLSPSGDSKNISGQNALGSWTGVQQTFASGSTSVAYQFKTYAARPGVMVLTAVFPAEIDTGGCGSNEQISTQFPSLNTSAAQAPYLSFVSWQGTAVSKTLTGRGLASLGANGLDNGPIAAVQGGSGATPVSLMWSTLSSHKIVVQNTDDKAGTYAMGLSAAIPQIPAGFEYSTLWVATEGGATAATYNWGATIQEYSNTTRLPSVTLTDVGYYTDDGAYYYVWEAFHIPARPWPAEEGLVLVKEALYAMGVPVAYMQLDDWWYTGPFYFGNVKAVVDWHASNVSRLFPHGLPAFSDKLDIPLQLYVPFWSDKFETSFNMTESTKFKGTKLVVPDESYAFFSDWFDFGLNMTNGRFKAFEIDFLDANFAGSASMFADVHAADKWYAGLNNAAHERGIAIQYCLPSATDMLLSLEYPAVVQARASPDYVNKATNALAIGGSALLMGACRIAPSKDTLWTRSPQPPTSSDREHSGYTTQPHVQLDAVLATLSLGPVGISDGLNQTDPALISQAFVSKTNSTLLRPARPVSWVDSFLMKQTTEDVRSTHTAIPLGPDAELVTHYVLAWQTDKAVMLGYTDLYPRPANRPILAMREHVVVGPADAGCKDGMPAAGCVNLTDKPTIAATGTSDPSQFSLTVISEPLPAGGYFLGELTKFVHVAPQRFTAITPGGTGKVGVTVETHGTAGDSITVYGIDSQGTVRTQTGVFPASGVLQLAL